MMNESVTSKKIKANRTQNYFGYAPPDREKLAQPKVLLKSELNAMVFKLKKYYNELEKAKKEKRKRVHHLREQKQNYSKKINDLIAFQDIELDKEKISVKEISCLKESKDDIERKIAKLTDETHAANDKYMQEVNYTQTLNHMIQVEKTNLENLNESLVTSQEKLMAIKYSKKNLEANNAENSKKNKNFQRVIYRLNSEIENLEELMEYQQKESNELTGNLEVKRADLEDLKQKVAEKNSNLEQILKEEKAQVMKEIKKTEEIKVEKASKESYCLKLILGLDLIQNYFISADQQEKEVDLDSLLKSDEFRTFNTNSYDIFENDKLTMILSTNSLYEDDKSVTSAVSTRIDLDKIKEKADNINIGAQSLFDFYTKVIKKTSFFHSCMINYNFKQINLESKKNLYTKKVKEIISKNYKNFDKLIQNNSRFENFMSGYQKEIKKKLEKEKLEAIRKKIENMIRMDDFPAYVEFSKKMKKFVEELKIFYEFVAINFMDLLKDIQGTEIVDHLKKTITFVKSPVLKNFVNSAKIPKSIYLNDILSTLESDTQLIDKIESEMKIEIKDFKEKVKENFEHITTMGLPFERILFYCVRNIENHEEVMKMIHNYFFLCSNLSKPHSVTMPSSLAKMNGPDDSDFGELSGIVFKPANETVRNYLRKADSVSKESQKLSRSVTRDKESASNSLQLIKMPTSEDPDDSYRSGGEESDFNNTNFYFHKTSRNPFASATKRTLGSKRGDREMLTKSVNPDQRVIEKFYMPFIKKRSYNTNLNQGVSRIKKNTRQSSMINQFLKKKHKDIDATAKELIIYNNPNINLEALSNNTYNSYVRYIISHQLEVKAQKEAEHNMSQVNITRGKSSGISTAGR